MLYKEGMRGQKTNFYVGSQKSGRPRPNGGGGKKRRASGDRWGGHLLGLCS